MEVREDSPMGDSPLSGSPMQDSLWGIAHRGFPYAEVPPWRTSPWGIFLWGFHAMKEILHDGPVHESGREFIEKRIQIDRKRIKCIGNAYKCIGNAYKCQKTHHNIYKRIYYAIIYNIIPENIQKYSKYRKIQWKYTEHIRKSCLGSSPGIILHFICVCLQACFQ